MVWPAFQNSMNRLAKSSTSKNLTKESSPDEIGRWMRKNTTGLAN